MISLDNSDKAILRELQSDASISNLELSKKIGLSPSACLTRTKNLRESGVIKQFTTIIDEKKLGMDTMAFVLVNLMPMNRDSIKSFMEDVNRFPQIQECYTLTGSHDFLLKIVARDTQSYRDFIIDTLTANPIINSVETLMVLGVENALPLSPWNFLRRISMADKAKAFRAAFPHTLPILAGFTFLGIAYGVLMQSKGFSWPWTLLMSTTIFAGSMEFVTVGLLAGNFQPIYAYWSGIDGKCQTSVLWTFHA